MSKRKKFTEDDEIERLREEIRELKSVNRSLLKRLKKIDRNYEERLEEEREKDFKETFEKKETKKESLCPKCAKGQLKVNSDIPGRIITSCETCEYRETKKVPKG